MRLPCRYLAEVHVGVAGDVGSAKDRGHLMLSCKQQGSEPPHPKQLPPKHRETSWLHHFSSDTWERQSPFQKGSFGNLWIWTRKVHIYCHHVTGSQVTTTWWYHCCVKIALYPPNKKRSTSKTCNRKMAKRKQQKINKSSSFRTHSSLETSSDSCGGRRYAQPLNSSC